jgi:SAM-dependent methyltransferase
MKKIFILLYRLTSPILDARHALNGLLNIYRYFGFIRRFMDYKKLDKASVIDLYPCLNDATSVSQTGKGHYFYQDIWALSKVAKSNVSKHIDIGSRIDGFAGQCSAICEVEFLDFRPVDLGLDNFSMKQGSILELPYEDSSISSLSCLHVIEHIGLGRYGDPMNPLGSIKAAKELVRVLSNGGNLYIGVPIGRERVAFNAHRIFNPKTIKDFFSGLELVEFCAVNDEGYFVKNASFADFGSADYSCGLFHFKKSND